MSTPVGRWVDRATSRLLQYDLSRSDAVKWVDFARHILAFLIAIIVLIAGLAAALSVHQAQDLLHASLKAQGRALGDAVARAAFVPLTLDDQARIAALVDSYAGVEHIGALRVRDAQGKIIHEMLVGGTTGELLTVEAPVVPVAPPQEYRVPADSAPIGRVEVGMRRDWIDAKAREIALTNVAITGGFAAVLLLVGMLVTRHLVDRTRELVGESRLVEQVRQANAELEAFAHSVSHDLRAPLRHVDGYIELLQAATGGKLDEKSAHYVAVIADSAKKMGTLIDDLLNFSRMGRAEMQATQVDLGALVRGIASDLTEQSAGRDILWKIGELPAVQADPSMLRQVLVNLLSNAVKYSSLRPQSVIEVGSRREARELVVFVRDNGAGFDMAYQDKLFGVFQRLHRSEDFEGTGIGLANVRRIIQRHGGRTWAEGAVDKGATFFFSLPTREGLRERH